MSLHAVCVVGTGKGPWPGKPPCKPQPARDAGSGLGSVLTLSTAEHRQPQRPYEPHVFF